MNALAVVLITATFSVDYGWTSRTDGGVEYIIQIEPEVAEALRSGELPDGVSSVILPEVQNVRAFRIVIGDDDLPREAIVAPAAPAESQGSKAPHTSMLAADTTPSLGSRYEFNPRYAPPARSPGLSGAVGDTVENMRSTAGEAINNAGNQLQNEASQLKQDAQNAVRATADSSGNALRSVINQASANQGAANPTPTTAAPIDNTTAGWANSGAPREQAGYQGNASPNGQGQSPTGQPQYGANNQPGQSQYSATNQPTASPGQLYPNNWPAPNPAATPAPNLNPSYGYQPGQQNPDWNNNWRGMQADMTASQQQGYQNQGQPSPQQNWQTGQQFQQPGTQYQNQAAPLQAPPLRQPNQSQPNPQYPSEQYQPNQYTPQTQYVAGNAALNSPANQAAPVQPVSQQQPAANVSDPRASLDAAASRQNTASESIDKAAAAPASRRASPTPSERTDPDTVAWIAVWLLLLSISGNLFLGYIASNFQKQTRKMAMQLRRVRT